MQHDFHSGVLALVLCLAVAAAPAANATRAATTAILDQVEDAGLNADMRAAPGLLEKLEPGSLDAKDRRERACILSRFQRGKADLDNSSDISDPFVRAVLETYRRYWWEALREPGKRNVLDRRLLAEIRALLPEPDQRRQVTSLETLAPVLRTALADHGYLSIAGRTPPLQELMLWQRQTTSSQEVALPEGSRRAVRVVLADDFISRGWTGYALCDRRATGGWALPDALFAVVPAYRDGIDGNEFKAVFLSHEAQHLADKNLDTALPSWRLEYRAKLAELWASDAGVASKRLARFAANTGDDQDVPHAYANKRILADLRQQLGNEPDAATLDRLHHAAGRLLGLDSQRLRKQRLKASAQSPAR